MIFGLYHSAGETVGLIGDVLKELKLPFTDVHLYDGDGLPRNTSDLEGLIVMGGPMNVDDVDNFPFLLSEVELIESVLSHQKPVLGICLGSQLIAKALGASVYENKKREVGWAPIELTASGKKDPFLSQLSKSTEVLHWHGDTFELPKDAELLATTSKCANQAFRWGRATYGLQFHPEVTPAMIKDWCSSTDSKDYIKGAGEDPARLLKMTPSACRQLEPVAKDFFRSYLKHAFGSLLPVS